MRTLSVVFAIIALPSLAFAQEPSLPLGLGGDEADTPALPAGLSAADDGSNGPSLPAGLGGGPELPSGLGGAPQAGGATDLASSSRSQWTENFTGFVEGRVGSRLQNDRNQDNFSIGEARLRVEGQWEPKGIVVRVAGDAVYDPVVDRHLPRLESGEGAFDLREANVVWRPLGFADIKAGRQILTWGVGDLIFINDLFPKDFKSFFIGRDDEYLKAPSDAVRVSVFNRLANADVVYTPRFDSDRHIDGRRLSYYNPLAGQRVGRNFILHPDKRDTWFRNDEIAARVYRQVGPFEIAGYGYHGYFKSPSGITPGGKFYFPELSVLGASARGPALGGIVTGEFGRYFSREDSSGSNPFVPNGEWRFLGGYEREIVKELTAAVQYYAQARSDQSAYLASLPPGGRGDRVRHLLTLRLTKLMFNQNLTLSGFNFWSPNQDDGHLRLRASYKLTDSVLLECGGNVFYGPRNDGFFSQLNDNTNVFVALRKSF